MPEEAERFAHNRRVWWGVLLERCNYDMSTQAVMNFAYRMGQRSMRYPQQLWQPIMSEYKRTDIHRQGFAEVFMTLSDRPDDTLVLLDIDHNHPVTTGMRLVAHDVPVVVPLMFRRGEPYDACALRRFPDGELRHLRSFQPGLHRMDAVGSGAIAIQRQVFERLMAAGHEWFFKYEYLTKPNRAPSEDLYFSKICEEAGIEMYVDTEFETPHITLGLIGRDTHEQWVTEHPEYGDPVSQGGNDGSTQEQQSSEDGAGQGEPERVAGD